MKSLVVITNSRNVKGIGGDLYTKNPLGLLEKPILFDLDFSLGINRFQHFPWGSGDTLFNR